eukprot:CAMPEP_0203761068 /NCGR_PEP_ID=MMETSP0098-20131031/14238_1 /ASSEMBLY_ACC=CAM_ASM_000208 /TAXON_ID=96639 /ORGANISM=" , Strain NY0313808BC1" /LENGTH=252 /DNA_ID=CAMNT_0050654903 /DNA_START=167 /DNA_END=925 /DNA_ORIENTATION=-
MSDKFAEQVLRIAVAQICSNDQFGNFNSAEGHAFATLVDVVGKYIEKIGRLCRRYAEHDGRTESNMLDLLQTFEKMEPDRVDWRDLERMCREVPWQVPYTSGVPDFPVEKRKRRRQYGEDKEDTTTKQGKTEDDKFKVAKITIGSETIQETEKKLEHPGYVPSHFPAFPERYTYANTKVDAKRRENDPKLILERNLEARRKVQTALTRIHSTSAIKPPETFGVITEQVNGEQVAPPPSPPASNAPKLPAAFK